MQTPLYIERYRDWHRAVCAHQRRRHQWYRAKRSPQVNPSSRPVVSAICSSDSRLLREQHQHWERRHLTRQARRRSNRLLRVSRDIQRRRIMERNLRDRIQATYVRLCQKQGKKS